MLFSKPGSPGMFLIPGPMVDEANLEKDFGQRCETGTTADPRAPAKEALLFMKKLHALVTEDSNQFGPGTDLIVAMLAVALVLITVSSYLYNNEKRQSELLRKREEERGGNFKVASISFSAGAFLVFPVTELTDRENSSQQVMKFVDEYRKRASGFAFWFMSGHAIE